MTLSGLCEFTPRNCLCSEITNLLVRLVLGGGWRNVLFWCFSRTIGSLPIRRLIHVIRTIIDIGQIIDPFRLCSIGRAIQIIPKIE